MTHDEMAIGFFREEAARAYTIATRIHTKGKSHRYWMRERGRALRMIEVIKANPTQEGGE